MNCQDWFMLVAGVTLCVVWIASALLPPPRTGRPGR